MSAAVRVRRSLPSGASRFSSVCPSCGVPVVLQLHADSKTAPRALWDPRKGPTAIYAQALALPSGPPSIGGTCSGFTSGYLHDGDHGGCDGCYGRGLERYSAVSEMVAANLRTLEHVQGCGGAKALTVLLVGLLDQVAASQLADGLGRVTFRWHSDGDVFSESYARAIAAAHRARPEVVGWIYTRTLGAVRHLVRGGDGLRVFVSVDRINVRAAATVAARHRVPVAILADSPIDLARISQRIAAVDVMGAIPSAVTCPASGKYAADGHGPAHIVSVEGKRRGMARGDVVRGACDACGLCLPSGPDRSVVFMRHGGKRDNFAAVRVSIGGAR